MTDFVKRIKKDINNPMNHRQWGGKTLVNDKDLKELIYHFESLDSAARADHDCKIPDILQIRQQCLVHEVQAAFNNLGAEETLDIVMFTIYELRKNQIKNLSINKQEHNAKRNMSIF
jgi:hypothetical protein